MKNQGNKIEDGSVMAGLIMLDAFRTPNRTFTLEEIAFVCGCSLENIRQIQKTALRKMKNKFAEIFEERGINYERDFGYRKEEQSSRD